MRNSLWRSVLIVGAVAASTLGIAGAVSVAGAEQAVASVSSSQNLPPIYSNWPENSTNWPCLATPSYGCAEGGYNATTAATTASLWPTSGPGYLAGASSNSGPHNCTLYAAYRLAEQGIPDPGVLGNASQWATSAHAKKILVNQTPSVGAIAQWNAGAGGDGHIAYVESVDAGGTGITISEDNYLPETGFGDLDGGYTARIHITAGSAVWPANFIHFTVPTPTVSSYSASPTTLTSSGGIVTLSANVTNATSCTFASKPAISGLPVTVGCSNGVVSDESTIPANIGKKPVKYSFTLSVVGSETVKADAVKVTESVGGTISKLVISQADAGGGLCQTTVVATGKNLLPAPTGGIPAPVSGTDYPNNQLAFVDNTSVPTPWSFGNVADGWDQNLIGITLTSYSNTSITFSFVNGDGYTAPQPGDEIYVPIRNSSTAFVAEISGPIPAVCALFG